MSKNLFLLLIVTIATCNNNWVLAMENDIVDNLDNIHKEKNFSSTLGSLFSNIRNKFGKKEQISITQELSVKQELTAKEDISLDTNGAENKNGVDTAKKIEDGCGTKPGQLRDKAKTLFGISFDKQELMYFGASAVVLITIGGIAYVIHKNEYNKKLMLEKVSHDMQKFVGEHKTAVTSTVVAVIVTAIALLCVKKQGITFESASNWAMNLFTKQSTTTKSIENSVK